MSACGVATLVVLFSLVTLQRSDTAERSAYQISEAATLTLAAAVETAPVAYLAFSKAVQRAAEQAIAHRAANEVKFHASSMPQPPARGKHCRWS